ncbi:type VI secretion system baseplate subunit TssE [Serratia sp. S1B]|nr:type VI secretion system baseplate subunit TssE [Serratia sp. S1B]
MEIKQQFLPTLLDRLLDDEPKKPHEAFDSTFFNGKTLRRLVQRDLMAVLNCTNIDRELIPGRHQHVAKAVVNYGISPLMGMPSNMNNWHTFEKNIRDAILHFEPRIMPESLIVRALREKDQLQRGAMLSFEIRGLIYWEPYPLDLCINGHYDSERESIELTNS